MTPNKKMRLRRLVVPDFVNRHIFGTFVPISETENFIMDTLQAIILGLVQGLTEFLPVSSSGHLQIANALLGTDLNPDSNVTFSLTLHAATVLSTIVVLWREVWRLLCGLFSRTSAAN